VNPEKASERERQRTREREQERQREKEGEDGSARTPARETRREKEKRWIHRVRKKCEFEKDHERENLREHDGQRSAREREKE